MQHSPSWEANRFCSQSRNSPHFLEPEGSSPHSQVPSTCPYPEPDQSSLYTTPHFLEIHLNFILPSAPSFSKWSLSLRFPHQNPVYISPLPIRATCPAHLITQVTLPYINQAQCQVNCLNDSTMKTAFSSQCQNTSKPPQVERIVQYITFHCLLTLWRLTTPIWVVPHS